MAKDSGATPYVLSLPNTVGNIPSDPLPRVELCTTAWHRHRLKEWSLEGGSRPVPPWHGISAAQPDRAIFTVTAAAAVASPASGSLEPPKHFLLEFLVYAERPHGEQDGNQSVYICGAHAAILPEATEIGGW